MIYFNHFPKNVKYLSYHNPHILYLKGTSQPHKLPLYSIPLMNQISRATIAAGHPKTAEAGIEMLKLGGNAFDGAVAAILASFVTETGLTSAAGGGFLLAHTHTHQNILFDFFVQTPQHRKTQTPMDFYPVYVDFGGAVQEFHIGLGSMGIPGNLAGVFEVHRKLGTLPFKVIAEPAIHYAKNGVKLNPFQHYLLTILKPIMTASPEARRVYAPSGELLQVGDTVFMKDFAATLAYLAETGAREFYEGDIAHQFVKDCQEKGGYLTLADLKNYRVIERPPLTFNYRGHTLLTNPPPSSGGTLIAFALELLSQIDWNKIEFGSDRHWQLLAQAMHLTNVARKTGYDAHLYKKDVAAKFLSSEQLTTCKQQFTRAVNKLGSTTHISIIDKDGNAASVTTSNGEGSSYMIPGTGIMVNNMLGEADLNPSGFHQWPENCRISSMMAPTMVLKNNSPEIVLGSGGSNRIRTTILQVISNIIDGHLDVKTAVENPRIHWENNQFHLEAGLAVDNLENLAFMPQTELIQWQEKNMYFGGVNAVRKREDGTLEAAGDPRRNGAIASC